MSSEKMITDLDNSLPFGISNHLEVYRAMDQDIREDPTSTLVRVQLRLPKANETIMSTRLGEVAFYEAVFSAGAIRFCPWSNARASHERCSTAKGITRGWMTKLATCPRSALMRVSLTNLEKKSPAKKSSIPFFTPIVVEGMILAQPMTTSTCLAGGEGVGFRDSAIKDPTMAIKLAQSSLLPIKVEMVNKMELEEVAAQFYHLNVQVVGQVKEMREGLESKEVAISSLKNDVAQSRREALTYEKRVKELTEEKGREKESFDLAKGELRKKIAELVEKEKRMIEAVKLVKVSAVAEFKASKSIVMRV
ncbi:hypothetical protein Acr_28g0005780 [Actinidia rufa]|uniref:Uncharacterized protein n=1 Tax=Actinidia rufa TaxID=165716 RepID=A0A7J0H9T3_9ERIC|nr:hypothetical protein Acr_28g0005780 [Actinidia rufa]